MDWHKYLSKFMDLKGIQVKQGNKGPVLMCKEWYGPEGMDTLMDLYYKCKALNMDVEIAPVPNSWASAHWAQLLEEFNIRKDDLPF